MDSNRKETFVAASITKAVNLEKNKCLTDSLKSYKEGIEALMELIKLSQNEQQKAIYRTKASEYLKRAESLSKKIEAENKVKQYREQTKISKGDKGNSYEKIFGPYLTDQVRGIRVEDPYIRNHVQVLLFLRFCEVAVKYCSNLVSIVLITGKDKRKTSEQVQKLEEIKDSLKSHNVNLMINYCDSLHDREIKFNTGWTFKIGRGLDFYKSVNSVFTIGTYDLDLRECLETTIDIFHSDSVSKFT
ncbi:MIT domain-containing protein 1 [Lepeophtheirus salmonis]|uniref:MIT, microtubule interacting and transport, domain containing 1 [Ficedula albicollis] n=1 Tax=Lepeophtheirus salmonis TaxID=72036 RepID=A0A0K2U1S9_LEPSM|nr:MIT domain-containing protein 1-like [Lepeophtheirus salmonis]